MCRVIRLHVQSPVLGEDSRVGVNALGQHLPDPVMSQELLDEHLLLQQRPREQSTRASAPTVTDGREREQCDGLPLWSAGRTGRSLRL